MYVYPYMYAFECELAMLKPRVEILLRQVSCKVSCNAGC